jgi:hypothetical protein
MFGTMDLRQVNRYQDELRRDAAQHRLAARINRKSRGKDQARRVFGLRVSLA